MLNDKKLERRWWNKNYFFVTTILYIAFIIALFAFTEKKLIINYDFGEYVNLNKFLQHFVNCFFS